MAHETLEEPLTSQRAPDMWFRLLRAVQLRSLVEAGEKQFKRNLKSQMRRAMVLVSDESSGEVEIVLVSHAPGLSGGSCMPFVR